MNFPQSSCRQGCAGAVLLLLLVWGCGAPPEDEPNIAPGEARVELGFVADGAYVPCQRGSEAPVIWGLQGGTWTMPVLRTRGIASPSHIEATLTLHDGEELGEADLVDELNPTKTGWLESDRFSIPVQHAPPNQYESISDLYGQEALIEVRVSDDDERLADYSVQVTLVEGD